MVRIASEDNDVNCNIKKSLESEDWQKNLRGLDDVLRCPRPDSWWTGKKPVFGTAGVVKDGTITALPLVDVSTCTRQQVLDYFENRWCLSEVLFSALNGEAAFYKPPYHQLRHPLIFYYCHPAALYINKLRVAAVIKEGINGYFEELFETGVDEMSWDDLSKNSMQWPSVSEVTEYRRQVYETVKNVILTHPEFDKLPITMDSQLWSLFMGFEHENIHIETSSVLMRELPPQYLIKPTQWPAYGISGKNSDVVPKNQFLKVERGQAVLGKPQNFPSFGWDNEYGERKFLVDDFEASQNLVSNGEFLEFVKSGSYRTVDYWSEQGWKWRSFRNAKWPTFWIPNGPAGLHHYKLRLIFEELDYLPLDLPVVVNHHEAKAYCNWLTQKQQDHQGLTCRLLTEAEHHRLRTPPPKNQPPFDPVMKFSTDKLKSHSINFNLTFGSETPVQGVQKQFNQYEEFINNTNQLQFNDVFGNLWQWCEDYISALPNSNGVHPYYDDFSTPCYDGQHIIIMGGSFISTGQEASIFARYHFRPHFFQHAGFRVVRSQNRPQLSHVDSPPPHVGGWNPSSNALINDNSNWSKVKKQVLMHYSKPAKLPFDTVEIDTQNTWSQSVVKNVLKMIQQDVKSVLIVGCGVGGVAFAMADATPSSRIVAVDANQQLISIARDIQANNEIQIQSNSKIQFHEYVQHAQNVEFKWMDPVALAPDLGEFDVVIMEGVLESTPSPKGPLKRMGGERGLVKKQNGVLVVISKYDWDEEICDKKLWLSAKKGDEKEAVQGLKKVLQDDCGFELLGMLHVPAILQTSGRVFEVQDHHLTLWKRG